MQGFMGLYGLYGDNIGLGNIAPVDLEFVTL